MRILLTGCEGQVGHELAPRLEAIGRVTAIDRAELDLEDEAAIRNFTARVRPDLIVNAAAWTAVDQAEAEPDRAAAVNHRAPAVLAEEALRHQAALVHFSTDYVFDGAKEAPWSESDVPAPLNTYGRTKLAGEEAVRDSGVPHVILRLSWVYGRRGHNFLNTMARLLRERPEVAVVDDQVGSPSWCRSIARATTQIISRTCATEDPPGKAFARVRGTYHLTGPGRASWMDFAMAIREHLANRGERVGSIRGVPSCEYPAAAARPNNSLLDSRRVQNLFGVGLPPWVDQLKECLADG